MKNRTLLLEVGGEGGSVKLVQIGDSFLYSTDETTLREFDPELAPKELISQSMAFSTFDEAMESLLGRYRLFGLHPLAVHPDCKAKVAACYREFCARSENRGFRGSVSWGEMLFGEGNPW
jgi:hypothetical protein